MKVTKLKVFDACGLVFGIAGAILLGNVNKWGFLSFVVSSAGVGMLGYCQKNWGLVVTSIIFIVIDIYYFIEWSLK